MASDRRLAGGRRPRAPAADSLPVVRGWTLAFHPCLLDQVERLVAAAEQELEPAGRSGVPGPNQKLLAHVLDLLFEAARSERARAPAGSYARPGARSLAPGQNRRRRYRLFFRFRSDARLIVFAWINDEQSLRTYGSATDAYRVFADRLARGPPPDDWDTLVAEASTAAARQRASYLRSRSR